MPAPTLLSLAPEIRADLQRIVDLMARLVDVPVGLINCRDGDRLEVGVASDGPDNPFVPGARKPLDAPGVYCETVIRTGEMLRVPDALQVCPWSADPAFIPEMIAYLGYPVRDPEGEVLGTICVMDRRARELSRDQIELVERMRDLVERHLALAWLNAALGDRGRGLAEYREEIDDLRAMIPICCACKNVRDDAGFWHTVESWFAARRGELFTHGICPDCLRRLYPELMEEEGA